MPRNLQISAIKPRVQYRADGVRREFVFPFPVFTAANLEVYLDDDRVTEGLTFSGIGETGGGSVAFANPPVDGATVTIRRRLLLQRRTDFQESGPFRASALNDELDYLTAAVQQLETEADRSLRLRPSDGEASMVLPPAVERAGRALVFDQNGDVATSPLGATPGGSPAWQTLDDVPEGQTRKHFGLEEKAKLQQVEDGAQVNPGPISAAEKASASETASRTFSPRDIADMVAMHTPAEAVGSVHGRTGIVVAEVGDYTAEQILDTAAKVLMTTEERTKLTGIAAGAQVNPVRIPAAEKTAGTATTIRAFAPVDVRDMVAGFAPAAPVASVAGRTGAVTLAKADVGLGNVTDDAQLRADLAYADKASPAGGDKLLLKDQADGLPKLVDWNQLPIATVPVASVHGRTGAIVAQAGDYSADDITDTAAKVLMTAAERTKLSGIAAGAQVNPGRIPAAEKTAGTATTIRGFAPVDVRDMVAGFAPVAPVASVAGRTGAVTLAKADVGLGNVTDDAQLRADLAYADKASPAGGDKLLLKDQADGLPKLVDWNQLPIATVPVASVHGRTGSVVAQAGDYSADDITDTAAKVLMTAAERTKLTGIAAGAQVNPIRVTAAEKSAGTSTILRGYAPVDVREMVLGAAPVASVHGRTGAIVAQAGDYTADHIADTAAKVLMTAAERSKLAGVAQGAQANPAMVTAAEKTAPLVTASRSFAPKDIADMIAGLVVNIDGGDAGSVFALTMP